MRYISWAEVLTLIDHENKYQGAPRLRTGAVAHAIHLSLLVTKYICIKGRFIKGGHLNFCLGSKLKKFIDCCSSSLSSKAPKGYSYAFAQHRDKAGERVACVSAPYKIFPKTFQLN